MHVLLKKNMSFRVDTTAESEKMDERRVLYFSQYDGMNLNRAKMRVYASDWSLCSVDERKTKDQQIQQK